MQVILKRDAFLGHGDMASSYRKSIDGGTTFVPDDLRNQLPPDAKIVEGAAPAPVETVRQEPVTLHEAVVAGNIDGGETTTAAFRKFQEELNNEGKVPAAASAGKKRK